MTYEFFLSYSRATSDEYLRRFVQDLETQVRLLQGLKADDAVAFFDQDTIERGENWDSTVTEALQTSKTLVAIYSPVYFTSEQCAKEWQLFHLRCEQYIKNKRADGHTASHPPAIKPVIWIPLKDEPPGIVSRTQYSRGNPDAIWNTKGLQYLCRQSSRFQSEYTDLIFDLAQDIVSAGRGDPLPRVPGVASYQDLEGPFPALPAAPDPSRPRAPNTSGPKTVRFVFVAAHPERLRQRKRATVEAYLECGGREWKPFFPGRPRSIAALAQSVAAAEDLDLYSEELRFAASLPDDIRAAEVDRNLVVLFVDGFTASLKDFRDVLEAFDRQNYMNCSVIVPWNDADPDAADDPELPLGIRRIFYFRVSANNPLFYTDMVRSEDAFRLQLQDVLTRLRAEIINKTLPTLPIPSGGSRPTISGPGSSL